MQPNSIATTFARQEVKTVQVSSSTSQITTSRANLPPQKIELI